MIRFIDIVCPVSSVRVDENKVRFTALWVVLLMGAFFLTGNAIFPALLAIDFYLRAFTGLKNSPLSWLSGQMVNLIGTNPVWIDKAPKLFAARIGLLLTSITAILTMMGLILPSIIIGAVLVGFAFLECGLNFCAGCWVYSIIVYPLVRKK